MKHLFAVAPDLLEDFEGFLPESSLQARLRTQRSLFEIERYEKVEPQAPVDGKRRKRAKYDSTDDEDEVLIHHAAKVAKRIPNLEPYKADNGNVLNTL